MKTIKYHGWILVDKQPGFKDHFSVEWESKTGKHHLAIGYGQAARAVDHFETTLGLGPIKLEPSPIGGLRVYTYMEAPEPPVHRLEPHFAVDIEVDRARLFQQVDRERYVKRYRALQVLRGKYPSYRDDQLLMFMLCSDILEDDFTPSLIAFDHAIALAVKLAPPDVFGKPYQTSNNYRVTLEKP